MRVRPEHDDRGGATDSDPGEHLRAGSDRITPVEE